MTAINPLISVLMPVYNAERYLREAVDSVLGQTFGDFELIAVDDGSTDGSLAILRDYERRDPRVRVLSRPNTGIVGALNDGLAVCRGEFIARMDADDVCLPERFERQLAEFRYRPDLVLLGTAALCTDVDLLPVRVMCGLTDGSALLQRLLEGDGFALLHPTIMMRAHAIRQVSGYNPMFPISEDLDLYLRLSEVGEIANITDLLLKYRMHPQSITGQPNRAVEFARRAALEARRRRGLSTENWSSGVTASEEAACREQPRRDRDREFGWLAWVSGFPQTARKYSYRTVKSNPLAWDAWKLLLVTHLKCPPKRSQTDASAGRGADQEVAQ